MYSFNNNLPAETLAILVILFIVAIPLWIYACRKKGWLGFFLCFFFSPFIGALIVAFLPNDEEKDKKFQFRCGVCYIKYRDELLGGETVAEGKICRFCLDKKQRGER